MVNQMTPSPSLYSEVLTLDAASLDQVTTAFDQIRNAGGGGTHNNDPRWLVRLPGPPEQTIKAVICREKGQAVGLLLLLCYPSTLDLKLGGVSLFSWKVSRMTMRTPPLVAPNKSRDDAILGSLFDALAEMAVANAAIYLTAVPDESGLYRLIHRRFGGAFFTQPYGNSFKHRSVALTGGYDAYLKKLTSRTRSDLKRTRRRFCAAVDDDYHVRCFHAPSDAAEFATEAAALSQKTWQYRVMGSGLRDHKALTSSYRIQAEGGAFRSYILYIRQRAAAFQVGTIYDGVFYAREIGYDPSVAKLQAGIFLHTEILQDLCTLDPPVRLFDFGPDDSVHKQRLSDQERTECHYYLFPRGVRGYWMHRSLQITNGVSSMLGRIAERAGLKARVRNWMLKSRAS